MLKESYKYINNFVKTYKAEFKELGIKNKVWFIYLFFIISVFIKDYKASIKNIIKAVFQKQIDKLISVEFINDMSISNQVMSMEMKIIKNTEYQSKDIQLESLIKNSAKSFIKLNAKATFYTSKEKG